MTANMENYQFFRCVGRSHSEACVLVGPPGDRSVGTLFNSNMNM